MFRSLFFHTFSTSCWMMPVSRIRLCRSRLSPDGGGRGSQWDTFNQEAHLLLARSSQRKHTARRG